MRTTATMVPIIYLCALRKETNTPPLPLPDLHDVARSIEPLSAPSILTLRAASTPSSVDRANESSLANAPLPGRFIGLTRGVMILGVNRELFSLRELLGLVGELMFCRSV